MERKERIHFSKQTASILQPVVIESYIIKEKIYTTERVNSIHRDSQKCIKRTKYGDKIKKNHIYLFLENKPKLSLPSDIARRLNILQKKNSLGSITRN